MEKKQRYEQLRQDIPYLRKCKDDEFEVFVENWYKNLKALLEIELQTEDYEDCAKTQPLINRIERFFKENANN